MQVPFLDLRAQHAPLLPALTRAVEAVIEDTAFILGPAVERFERAFAEYIGVRHCVGLNNGTSALQLALLACDIKPGDEVITTPHTWISTAWGISYVGAKPVFADIDPATFLLDPDQVKRAITPRTRAILPVHLYGQAADLERLGSLAKAHNLALIEDAAQAHGAMFGRKRVGSIGRVGCFSFYPGKNLGACGEAGAITTDNDQIATRIRQLRDHAQAGRHHHVEIGFNMRMEGVQGAILAEKLPHLEGWTAARRKHAARYRERLQGTPNLRLPECPYPNGHVWHLYVVVVEGVNREALRARLSDRGIQTGVHYPTPVPSQTAYSYLGYGPRDFPIAQRVMSNCVSLPMFPELTEEQVDYVASALREELPRCRGSASQ